jgi:integrase
MGISFQRRHGPGCAANRKQGSFSYEADELRKGAKRCDCRIYAVGTLAGEFRRHPTKERTWSRAKEAVAPFLAAGRWDVSQPPPPSPVGPIIPPPKGGGDSRSPLSISDAVEACVKEHERAGSARSTIDKYRQVLGIFARASVERGFRYLDDWKPADIRAFRDSWTTVRPRTAVGRLSLIKAFFEIFLEDGTLASNPARLFRARRNRAMGSAGREDYEPRNPFTDEELKRMLEGCRMLDGRKREKVVPIEKPRIWTGEDLADLIELSLHTGLRISDVVMFDVSRLTPTGEVELRAIKNGVWISVWIPEWLRERIRRRAERFGSRIFWRPMSYDPAEDLKVACEMWRRRLARLWKVTGPYAQKPVHHRFRHTFVRIMLERGLSPSLIAEFIGDSEAIVRTYYSQWIPSRRESASRMVAEAFANAPRFHR